MATESGLPGAAVAGRGEPLERTLFREGYRFEFFQAVRLLERLHADRRPVGRHERPADEVVRFRVHSSLAFPPSEIHEIAPAGDQSSDPDVMSVNFMGLTGLLGALPRHYTSLLCDPSTRAQTAALAAFFDLFNHRLISLFYRAWEKYRFTVAYERAAFARGADAQAEGEAVPDVDRFSENIFCLIGLGTPGLRQQLRIDHEILLYYAGLLAQRPRSAVALEGILQDYFDVPVEVVQFQGQWFEMNADLLTSLGSGGRNNQLGVTAVLWERIFDPQARFRIRLGPLTYTQFRDFLPGAAAYNNLLELARFYVGEDVNFEVQPMLRREDVPWCVLGGDRSVRLGWSMWLKTGPFEDDVPQPVFGARLAAA